MKIVSTDKNGTTEREVPDDVFTFQEGDHWIAAWRHYDVLVQGKTETEACERLLHNLAAQCLWDAREGHRPFEHVLPPPPDVLAEWERRHREAH